jgi:hypothetical protein
MNKSPKLNIDKKGKRHVQKLIESHRLSRAAA